MAERRKAVRARTLLGGVIAFNSRASTMDCQVRNLSSAGAKVTFTNTAVVPDQFDLMIARKERSFRARVIWRAPNEAGIVPERKPSGGARADRMGQTTARLRGREDGFAAPYCRID